MADHFGIIGFPWDGGASLGRPGARDAPHRIRNAFHWFSDRIQGDEIYHIEHRRRYRVDAQRFVDYGDIDIAAHSTEITFSNATKKAGEVLRQNGFPFVLGGDHSVSYPIIKALHDSCTGQVGIIHFDAHLDLVDESPTQGRYSQSSEIRRALELERVSPRHVVQIGVRGFNYPWYGQYLRDSGIRQYTAMEVHEGNALEIARQTLHTLSDCEKVYLTFDIDVLDPAFAPGTGADEPFGLTPAQCMQMLGVFFPAVHGADIVEVNPAYDLHGITAAVASRVMLECFVSLFGTQTV